MCTYAMTIVAVAALAAAQTLGVKNVNLVVVYSGFQIKFMNVVSLQYFILRCPSTPEISSENLTRKGVLFNVEIWYPFEQNISLRSDSSIIQPPRAVQESC